MKRIALMFCATMIMFCGCEKSRYEKNAEAYAGKYWGEFSTTRVEENVSVDTLNLFEVSQNVDEPENLVLQKCIPLTRTEEGYVFESAGPTEQQLSAVFSLCGIGSDHFVATVDGLKVTANFYTGTATLYIRYKNGDNFIGTTTFTGSKQ